MKELIIILGVVVLSGTNALATNLETINEVRYDIKPLNASSASLEQVNCIDGGRCHNTLIQEVSSNSNNLRKTIRSVVAESVPPDRGSAGRRGGSTEGAGSR
jgi:hypothetical protein